VERLCVACRILKLLRNSGSSNAGDLATTYNNLGRRLGAQASRPTLCEKPCG